MNVDNTRAASTSFLRAYWSRAILISAALLVPCFWHPTIQAGDLASHTYNAWLAQLIERGQAPGLRLAHQSNNVLFDLALLHLGNIFGLRVAERIAVCAAVLLFFWGAFAFVCSMARRVAWTTIPLLAVLAYGWTFAQGFFNFYISLGLAFWGLALIQSGRGRARKRELWLLLALAPLIWMAHPLGLGLLAAIGSYLLLAEKFPGRGHLFLFMSGITLLLAVRLYLASHFHSLFAPGSFFQYLVNFNGSDQLILYGSRYRVVSYLFFALIAAAVVADYFARREDRMETVAYRLPLQLYGVFLIAGFLLPWVVFLPQYGAPLGMITERLSLITAVMACCLLGAVKPMRWHFAAITAIAVVFFFFLYQDTGTLDRMEQQATRLERSLPRVSRVVSAIDSPPGSRVLIHHLVDRSCIGYCFSYGNYEPSTRQFRVRATLGNPYVTADWDVSESIRSGTYHPQPQAASIFQIYRCNPDTAELCIRNLAPRVAPDFTRDQEPVEPSPQP